MVTHLDEARLSAQVRHLRETQDRRSYQVLAGTEVDILADGSLDLDLGLLRGHDWVIASVHSRLDMPGDAMTDRLIAAMATGVVDCLGHPTNRRLGSRSGSELDWERLLHAARRDDVAIEVNGNPYRMDLPDVACRSAREAGVPVVINTDAHAPQHLAHRVYGVVTARRGWIEPRHVLNTRPAQEIADRRTARFRALGVAVSGWTRWEVPEGAPLYPETPVTGPGHWPDEVDAPSDEADASDRPALTDTLAERPVASDVRERVEAWMREGGDPELEAALGSVGPNAMQAAFNLLHGV
ncbi:MAG: DNA polymerase (family 10) [Myxococcota bacterium]